jgi:hypothetical protein
VAAAELPGMQPTTGYLDFSDYPVERIAEILKQKLEQLSPILLEFKFGLDLLGIFGLPLLQFNSRGMDRCFGSTARFWGIEGLLPYGFLSIKPRKSVMWGGNS